MTHSYDNCPHCKEQRAWEREIAKRFKGLRKAVLRSLNKDNSYQPQKEISNREVNALIRVLENWVIDELPDHTPYEGD